MGNRANVNTVFALLPHQCLVNAWSCMMSSSVG
jgi:hypothetical protein